MFWIGLLIGVVLGGITAGYVVKNNASKAFKLMEDAKIVAELELAKIKKAMEAAKKKAATAKSE